MDTRCWFCEAIVTAFKLDPDHGPFADIIILPSEQAETVRVGPFYAGPGFGFYAPLDVDDHVVVSFPDGDPDRGGVIVGRLWSQSDKPPSLANDNDADVCLQVKKDTNLRIQVFGSGNVVIGAEDGKVLLGDETGTKPVARKEDRTGKAYLAVVMGLGPLAASVASVVYTDPDGVVNTLTTGNLGPVEVVTEIKEGSDKVESS